MASSLPITAAGNGGYLLPAGYLSTQGSQIVDAAGTPVRIASIGWNQGFDNIPASVSAMKAAGFNTIRVSWVNATMDGDLQRIDQIVAAAKANGLKVILDNHTNEPGHGPQDNWGAQQKNGLWYDVGGASDGTDGGGNWGTTTDAKFLQDWVTVAQRYAGNDTVAGFDLRNEPLEYGNGSTWGDGNFNTDIRLMYQRVGNAIQAVNSGPLIIAEGPQNYSNNSAGTGPAPWGDLSLAGSKPVTLNVANKVVYSVHDYPQEISGWSQDNGAAKIAAMNADWGYLVTQNIAPVWIGEMGSSMQDSTDAAWARTLLDYMNGKYGAQGGPTFTGNQQGVSGDWWAWGNLPGQYPDGTLNADGSLKADQAAVWSQLLYKPSSVPVTPPVVTPPVVTPPAPPSADNTVITGTSQKIVDAQGNTWTITAGGQVAVNGVADATTGNVVKLAYEKGLVWQENTSNLWWSKAAPTDSWGPTAGTATSPVPGSVPPVVTPPVVTPPVVTPPVVTPPVVTPPVTPAQSADNTIVTTTGKAIVDAQGNSWTITAGGQVAVNGVADATTGNVVELAYEKGLIWQENTGNLWWSKSAPTDVWGPTAGTATSPVPGAPPPVVTPPVVTPPAAGPGSWLLQTINGMQYMVLLPAGYDPTVKYATTLYLHQLDNGSFGPQPLQDQINAWFNTTAFRSAHPSIIVAPLLDQNADMSGQTINFGGVSTNDTAGESNAIAALKQVMAQYSADPSRVYVTGNSMGGIGSWDMLIKYNAYTGTEGKIFAAGMPLAGADYGQGFPNPPASIVQALKNVPIWAIHGAGDTQVSLAWDQNLFAAEQAAGGLMKYTQDANLGHDVWDTYYTQTAPFNWLYSQSLSGTPQQPPPPPVNQPPVVPSADNTLVPAGSSTAITDTAGNKWTITAGGQVAVNGIADTTTAGVILLAYEQGVIWQENTASLWWSKTLPTDAWGPTAGTSISPVLVLPVPPPVVTPPVVTPPVITPSADNTVIQAGSTAAITDAAGNKWTITAGGQVAVNGTADATTAGVIVLAYEKGVVWQENTAKLWWSKTLPTDAWGPTAGTATSPVPPVVTPPVVTPPVVTPSADNTVVMAGSTAAITDAAGNKWTITAGGQVAINGKADTLTAGVVELAYEKGVVWQENTAKLWWSKTLPTDAWGPTAGTATSPVPVVTPPTPASTISVLTSAGQSRTINGAIVATTKVNGDTFTITKAGVGTVVLGSATETLRFVGMTSVTVTGSTGKDTLIADGGKNTFNLGKGAMDVTGGKGADAYVLHAATGTLTIEDFSAAKGDTLKIDPALKPSVKIGTDGHGGTLIAFTGVTETVDLKGVASFQSSAIRWA